MALAVSVSAVAGCSVATANPADTVGSESRLQTLKSDLAQLRDSEDRSAALAVVRQMRDVDPQHPDVFIQAVILHLDQQQFDEAEAFLSTLVESGPGGTFARRSHP